MTGFKCLCNIVTIVLCPLQIVYDELLKTKFHNFTRNFISSTDDGEHPKRVQVENNNYKSFKKKASASMPAFESIMAGCYIKIGTNLGIACKLFSCKMSILTSC